MTSVSLEVYVRPISISGAQKMDRAMLPDSQGDNHQTENHRIQSTRQFDKKFYAS